MTDSGSLPPPPGSDPSGSSSFPPPPGQGGRGGEAWGGGGGYGAPAEERNGAALASMISGIIAVVCLLLFFLVLTIPVAILCAIAALITGVIGLRASRRPGVGGRGQAIAGLVTGAISLALVVLVAVAAVTVWNSMGFDSSPFTDPEGFLREMEDRGVEIDEEGRVDPESLEDLMQEEAP